ncbi:MAG TPA: M48 family metallopeptidase, partial [Pirellulales bacterium]|nr:M48 family metallopeptidase [Pirellulales bacterium]
QMMISQLRLILRCTVILALLGAGLYLGCRSAPVTQRRQLLLMPESQEVTMGATAYEQILAEEQISSNAQYHELVNRVGQRIAAAAQRPDFQWEFRVIDSPQQNAFALPGGKVAVHEGILPVCANEAGLAVVMSHEVAHALARHGGERMSHGMVVKGVQNTVDYFTKGQEAAVRDRILAAYGVASKYGVVLPYSRKQEAEADHIGVLLMAKAGYDPTEAPAFWERFAQMGQGQKPPEFLSTHPSDATRSANLRKLLPEAQQLYSQAAMKYGLGDAIAVAAGSPGPAFTPNAAPTGAAFVPQGHVPTAAEGWPLQPSATR